MKPESFVECERCGIHLPLRIATAGERQRVWECSNCGCRQPGIYDLGARDSIRRNVVEHRESWLPSPLRSAYRAHRSVCREIAAGA
jgi:uncharacterized Zn finger protein